MTQAVKWYLQWKHLERYNPVVTVSGGLRPLRLIECEALMGFRKSYTDVERRTAHGYELVNHRKRWELLGNAFSVPVIAHLLRPLERVVQAGEPGGTAVGERGDHHPSSAIPAAVEAPSPTAMESAGSAAATEGGPALPPPTPLLGASA